MLPEVTIVPYQDGPYLVRGPVVLRDQDGELIECRRPTIALCRCGKSRRRPFCDGTHQLARFTAPSWPEDRSDPVRPPALAAGQHAPEASAANGDRDTLRSLGRVSRQLENLARNGTGDGQLRRQLVTELRRAADQLEDMS